MDLEQKAIERIKYAAEMTEQYYEKPLICTYSGGKDSDVLLELFKRSGVPFIVQHSHTTVDAPETVYHVRNRFKELEEQGIECEINYPYYKGKRVSMWTLIPQKGMPPTRLMRYCCQVFKEQNGGGSFIATGVRKAESTNRQARTELEGITAKKANAIRSNFGVVMSSDNDEKRLLIEHCKLKGKMIINPIIDWNDRGVWEYIRSENIKVNPLYQCGYNRVGCIGCNLAGRKMMLKEFADYPTYKKAYIHAFDRMIEVNKSKGKITEWENGQDVFDWWIQDPNIKGQLSLF